MDTNKIYKKYMHPYDMVYNRGSGGKWLNVSVFVFSWKREGRPFGILCGGLLVNVLNLSHPDQAKRLQHNGLQK